MTDEKKRELKCPYCGRRFDTHEQCTLHPSALPLAVDSGHPHIKCPDAPVDYWISWKKCNEAIHDA